MTQREWDAFNFLLNALNADISNYKYRAKWVISYTDTRLVTDSILVNLDWHSVDKLCRFLSEHNMRVCAYKVSGMEPKCHAY